MHEPDLDFVSACVDEIALEGLDGITLSAFWQRLQNRPHFSLKIDDQTKSFIWNTVASHSELKFYVLPAPRPSLIVFNRYNHVDVEMGIITEPDSLPNDIYPVEAVKDGKVQGSCAMYKERTDVTSGVRSGENDRPMSLDEAEARWGESLIVVASQELRTRALVGMDFDPTLELSAMQYLMLERIGRSRYHGEVTQGKWSLMALGESPKYLHYQRKRLLAKHLITKQVHYQRSASGQTTSGMLLHLTRFYVEKRPKFLLMLEQMCEILSKMPGKQAAMQTLRAQLGMKEGSFKKMFHKYLNFTTPVLIPLREVTPGLPEAQYFHANKREKTVKGLRLNDHVDINHIGKDYEDEESVVEEDDDDEADDGEDLTKPGVARPLFVDVPLLAQVLKVLEDVGPDGATGMELSRCLGLPKLEIRLLCRNLQRHQVVSSIMKDIGRQRVSRFVSRRFDNTSELCQQFLEERRKLLQMVQAEDKSERTTPEPNLPSPTPPPPPIPADALGFGGSEVEETLISSPTKLAPDSKNKRGKSFLTDIEVWDTGDQVEKAVHLTYRMMKRANLILQTVQRERLVDDVFKLQKMIVKEESQEGYFRIDKKSVLRLVHKLAKDNYLRSFRTVLRLGNKVKKLHFVCAPEILETDPIVRSAVDQAKFKYFFATYTDQGKPSGGKGVPECFPTSVQDSIKALQSLNNINHKTRLQYEPGIGRLYGICPKFIRMKNLHEFIFYLVYDYAGTVSDPQQMSALQLWEPAPAAEQPPDAGTNAGATSAARVPKVYHQSVTWKRHVPPLPTHQGWASGWCLISDVLLRIPLCTFVTLVNFNHKIEGLDEYLRDPYKCLYLIAHLPQRIRNGLLYGRRYIFTIVTVAEHLANIGLLSFGPHQYKEKDQKFVFVHKRGSVMNTTTTLPSYFQTSADQTYPRKVYEFNCSQDVDKYWFDMRLICLNTQLGYVTSPQGQAIVLERLDKKPAMIETCRPKGVDEIVDDGTIPGDQRGAGGLDSALFAHLKRNWAWLNNAKSTPEYWLKRQTNPQTPQTEKLAADKENAEGVVYLQHLQDDPVKKGAGPANKRLGRLAKNKNLLLPTFQLRTTSTDKADVKVSKQQRKPKSERTCGQKRKRRPTNAALVEANKRSRRGEKVVRVVQQKKRWKVRRPYYDDKDRAALRLQSKLRVDWNAQEDSLLLLCKVASNLLSPNHYQLLVVTSACVRDLLQEFVPGSNNKTSRACQRRIMYMMRNPQTAYNVAVFVGEAKQDEKLMEGVPTTLPRMSDEAARNSTVRMLVGRLVEKFKNTQTSQSVVRLPSSMDELNSAYSIAHTEKFVAQQTGVLEVHNLVDIRFSVVTTLILSSLCCQGDRANWSYQLFRIYQQYPETLLRSVFTRLRNEKLISRRKEIGSKSLRVLPLSTLPYQLSITFEYKFLSRFQQQIYHEANRSLQVLLSSLEAAVHSNQRDRGMKIVAENEGGVVATVIALMADRKLVFNLDVPEQAILFDKTYCEKVPQQAAHMKTQWEQWERACGSPSAPKKLCTGLAGVTHSTSLYDSGPHQSQPAARPESAEPALDVRTETVKSGVGTSVWGSEGNMNVEVEVCLPPTSSTVTVPPVNRASRVALYMLREQMTENPAEKLQHSQDYFVVNSCTVHCHLCPSVKTRSVTCPAAPEDPSSGSRQLVPPPSQDHTYTSPSEEESVYTSIVASMKVDQQVKSKLFTSLSRCLPAASPSFAETARSLPRDYAPVDVEDLERIYVFIVGLKEMGATFAALTASCPVNGAKLLGDHLRVMVDHQLVLPVGVSARRYVAFDHSKPWVLKSVLVPKDQRLLTKAALEHEASLQEKSSRTAVATTETQEEATTAAIPDTTEVIAAIPEDETTTEDVTETGSSGNATGLPPTEAGTSHHPRLATSRGKGIEGFLRHSSRRRRQSQDVQLVEQTILNWDSVRFICRPWRKPDGVLNKPVLQTMLGAILSMVMSSPGISFRDVAAKLCPALQPVHTLELLDILENIQCVRRIGISCNKPTLFGKEQEISFADPATVDTSEDVLLETEIDCVIRLGQFFGGQ